MDIVNVLQNIEQNNFLGFQQEIVKYKDGVDVYADHGKRAFTFKIKDQNKNSLWFPAKNF